MMITKNKKATFNYEILEKVICGVKLIGSEVKSIRLNNVSISEAYCYITDDNEVFIKNMHIAPYEQAGTHNNHEPLRERKLLLKKKEITNLSAELSQKGLTLIPISVFITKEGFIKIEIGLCKGKKLFDKRSALKEKDIKKELAKSIKI